MTLRGIDMNFIGTQTIETSRFILRKVNLSDAEDMFQNWASDENVARYVTWLAHKDISTTIKVIEAWINKHENEVFFGWCIEWKENAQVIGTIDVATLKQDIETAEIGYCLSQKYWGKGIMTEALIAVANFLFSEVGVNRIEAKHHLKNPASGKVMIKSGMQFEGIQRQATKDNMGNYCDLATYAILKSDWEKKK